MQERRFLTMGKRIERSNFKTIDGITYSFDMDDHLNHKEYKEDFMLEEICKAVAKYYKDGEVSCKTVFRSWARDTFGIHIIIALQSDIPPEQCLYKYLDEESRKKGNNKLVWKKRGSNVTITVFGPL